MKKYYFLTYQARSRVDWEIYTWNDVTGVSPIQYIKDAILYENESENPNYTHFAITFCMEISNDEYEKWNGTF